MLELSLLKMMFKRLGATRIKFDTANERLIISDEKTKKAKAIKFSEIERLFNERKGS